ncbi:MAG: hypothetical protein KME21_20075 [Desmonostoc vinosum HA7617-LM4]|jgi:hypothetical protein|nr:hypothetical protein [Desmonostoc vinosum HA7617-LM4]
MFLKKLNIMAIMLAFSFSGAAIAQTTDNNIYIQVGEDNNGNPITLDVTSIKGTEYTLLYEQGEEIARTTFHASCGKGRLFSKRVSFYTAAGKLTRENKIEREVFPKPGTADANSMAIVCQAAETQ